MTEQPQRPGRPGGVDFLRSVVEQATELADRPDGELDDVWTHIQDASQALFDARIGLGLEET